VNVTVITITDPALLAQLVTATGQIAFCTPTGETVLTVQAVPAGGGPPGAPALTDEEPAARKLSEGHLDELWKRIHEKYGKP
jgi:hypothetical protein